MRKKKGETFERPSVIVDGHSIYRSYFAYRARFAYPAHYTTIDQYSTGSGMAMLHDAQCRETYWGMEQGHMSAFSHPYFDSHLYPLFLVDLRSLSLPKAQKRKDQPDICVLEKCRYFHRPGSWLVLLLDSCTESVPPFVTEQRYNTQIRFLLYK